MTIDIKRVRVGDAVTFHASSGFEKWRGVVVAVYEDYLEYKVTTDKAGNLEHIHKDVYTISESRLVEFSVTPSFSLETAEKMDKTTLRPASEYMKEFENGS